MTQKSDLKNQIIQELEEFISLEEEEIKKLEKEKSKREAIPQRKSRIEWHKEMLKKYR